MRKMFPRELKSKKAKGKDGSADGADNADFHHEEHEESRSVIAAFVFLRKFAFLSELNQQISPRPRERDKRSLFEDS